jgi:hypothetical protein
MVHATMKAMAMCCAQEAAAWGMASHISRGVEGEGDSAAVVREAVALAGEIIGKGQIAVQACHCKGHGDMLYAVARGT